MPIKDMVDEEREKSGHNYFPVFLDVKGKRCVVIGGGNVALRKVRMLLECGARVAIVSSDICPELNELAKTKKISALHREYQPGDLKDTFVAIAATSKGNINKKVAQEAEKNNIMINVVDDLDLSGFILPSYFRRGDLTLAVSTSGKSPALAKKIRKNLEYNLSEEYSSLTSLIDDVRQEMKRRAITVNGDRWQECLDLDLLTELLRSGKRSEARAMLVNNLEKMSKAPI